MRVLSLAVTASAAALCSAAPAAAELDWVLGGPRAAAGATIDMASPQTVSQVLDDFGTFSAAITREHPVDNPYVRIVVDYHAELETHRFAARGSVSAEWVPGGPIPAELPVFGQGGQASASLRAQFFVTEPIDYRLTLTTAESGIQGRVEDLSAHVTLIKGNTLPINIGVDPTPTTTLTGTLTPEFYVLQFTPTARAWERGELFGSVTFDFEFVLLPQTPACPADFDGQNGVQVADIFAFLRAWFANAPSADFDGQNGIQVADIFAFLRAWFAGCP